MSPGQGSMLRSWAHPPGEKALTTESRVIADGRYELFETIGTGGMATVYRAHDNRLGVDRAIKVLLPAYASKQTVRARFEAEARTMAVLEHSNIVRVYDVGSDDETAWIVMELIDGPSLLGRIKQAPVGVQEALEITASVLQALAVAHANGVVHRDIKPHNVLLSTDGTTRITDFGIARSNAGSTEDSHTKTGTVMGTWAFMAPEQRVDAKGVDHTVDIYGVGATLFAMATGETPMDLFASDLDPDMLTKVPDELVPLIRRATRYQRDERYPHAQSMLEAVHAIQKSTTGGPATIRTPRPSPPPVTAAPDLDEAISLEDATSLATEPDPEPKRPAVEPMGAASETMPPAEGIDVNTTPLPFRPQTSPTTAPETQLYPPVKRDLRRDKTVLWGALVLTLIAGGTIRRVIKSQDTNDSGPQVAEAVEVTVKPPAPEPLVTPAQPVLPSPVAPSATAPSEPAPIVSPASNPPVPQTSPAETDPVAVDAVATIDVPADRAVPAEGPPRIEHTMTNEIRLGSTLSIEGGVANLSSSEMDLYRMTVYFRPAGSAQYRNMEMSRDGGIWTARIPVGPDMEGGLQYFIKASPSDTQEGRLGVLMSRNNRDPHSVRVTRP